MAQGTITSGTNDHVLTLQCHVDVGPVVMSVMTPVNINHNYPDISMAEPLVDLANLSKWKTFTKMIKSF
jgi:hypothetical protein